MSTQQQRGIIDPHEHDVLSGRGNFVNYHAGNEYFRNLVRKHKVEYVACPKPQKGKFSKMIYDEIRNRNPPGRFLKQDNNTKLWYDIGEKKALDKTRQALREGAPDIMKDLGADDSGDEGDDIPVNEKPALPQHQTSAPQTNSLLNAGASVGLNSYTDGSGRFQLEPTPIQSMATSMSNTMTTQQPHLAQHQYISNDRVMHMTPDLVVRSPEMMTTSNTSMGRFNSLLHPGMTAPDLLLQESLLQQQQLQQQQLQLQQQHHHHRHQQQQQQQQQHQVSPQRGLGRNSSMPLPSIYMMDRTRMLGGNAAASMHGNRLNDLDTQLSRVPQCQQLYSEPLASVGRPTIMSHKSEERLKAPYDDDNGTKPDHVPPLPPRRINLKNVRAELKRQGSDGSLQIDSVFGGAGNKMGLNNSSNHLSIMSLSVSDMTGGYPVPALHREDHHESDTLGPLFNSSMRLSKGSAVLGRLGASSNRKNNFYYESLSSASDLRSASSDMRQGSLSSSEIAPHVMDMSVATLGDRFSDFGESSRMTDMSFTNVFEDIDEKD